MDIASDYFDVISRHPKLEIFTVCIKVGYFILEPDKPYCMRYTLSEGKILQLRYD